MLRIFGALGVCTLVIALSGQPGSAQWGRAVNVNGHWLGPADLAAADRLVGFELPNGFYWYDQASCIWGLVGEQYPRGQVPCQGAGNQRPTWSSPTPPTCDDQGCFLGRDWE
jgi:hypothetical protein